jgi:hypothetical protein
VTARLLYGRSADTEGCPTEEELRREISHRVGYDPIVLWSPNGVAVTITRRGDRLVADVRLVGRDGALVGVRTLEAGRTECAALSRAIALAVGIALDMIEKSAAELPPAPPSTAAASQAEMESAQTSPAAPVAQAPAPSSPPEAPEVVDRRPVRADRASSRLEVGAAIAGSVAVLPTPSAGPSLFVSLRWATWELGLEARAELAARTSEPSLPSAGLQAWVISGGPFICAHFSPFFGCLLASAGALGADVSNVSGAEPGWAPYVALGGRAGLLLALPGGFAFRPSLSLVGQPVDLSVQAAGARLWRSPPVAGVAEFAIARHFP